MNSKDKTKAEKTLANLERRVEAEAKKRDNSLMAGDVPAAEKAEKHMAGLSLKADMQRQLLRLIAEKEVADLDAERREKIRTLTRELEQLEKALEVCETAGLAVHALFVALQDMASGLSGDSPPDDGQRLNSLLADANKTVQTVKPVDLKGSACIQSRISAAVQERGALMEVGEAI